MQNSVALVLDDNFGTRLSALATEMPVWIVSSRLNDIAIQAARPTSGESRITAVLHKTGETQEDLLARALYAIDEHHGEASQLTPYNTIEIHGVLQAPSNKLMSELGFKTTSFISGVFVAVK